MRGSGAGPGCLDVARGWNRRAGERDRMPAVSAGVRWVDVGADLHVRRPTRRSDHLRADVELFDEHELGVNIPGATGIVDLVAGVDTFSMMKRRFLIPQ